jgi:hypothetical protein
MPTLGAPLDFAKLEARNLVGHLLGTAPSSPVKGQMYMNTADNTLYWFDGTVWVAAKAGAGTPTGPAGGDLSGTYPNPQIAAGVIVDADVAAANKDGAVATPSLRTLGAGAQQAMPGNRTLDAITAPAADLFLNSKKITSLADPTAAQDAATKTYVDGLIQGVSWKQPVKLVATTSIGGGSTPGGVQTIDGVATGANDRVLLTAQANPQFNGIYITNTGSTWSRDTDANSAAELVNAACFVGQGTAYADTAWTCTTNAPITVDTTPLTWVAFTGVADFTAGAGLSKTGNTVDVGQGSGISVAADTVAVDTTVARYYSSATHSAGATISIPQATHGCKASRGLVVQCQIEATGAVVLPDIVVAANGDVTVTFAVSQSANTIRTTVIG